MRRHWLHIQIESGETLRNETVSEHKTGAEQPVFAGTQLHHPYLVRTFLYCHCVIMAVVKKG
jgi:hypothetical protein